MERLNPLIRSVRKRQNSTVVVLLMFLLVIMQQVLKMGSRAGSESKLKKLLFNVYLKQQKLLSCKRPFVADSTLVYIGYEGFLST
eukprot:snap_masked-scaffold_11-processed-gene-1.19-mRNA-1 protein AED:1.00 eAED:1.00 QI:0/0/0/0/1/1/3/0/84